MVPVWELKKRPRRREVAKTDAKKSHCRAVSPVSPLVSGPVEVGCHRSRYSETCGTRNLRCDGALDHSRQAVRTRENKTMLLCVCLRVFTARCRLFALRTYLIWSGDRVQSCATKLLPICGVLECSFLVGIYFLRSSVSLHPSVSNHSGRRFSPTTQAARRTTAILTDEQGIPVSGVKVAKSDVRAVVRGSLAEVSVTLTFSNTTFQVLGGS